MFTYVLVVEISKLFKSYLLIIFSKINFQISINLLEMDWNVAVREKLNSPQRETTILPLVVDNKSNLRMTRIGTDRDKVASVKE